MVDRRLEYGFYFRIGLILFSYCRMFSALSRSTVVRRCVAVRSFSDAIHRPVIDIYGIHARYANATYIAASKAGTLDTVEAELNAIAKSAGASPAFKGFLENPLIAR